MSPAKPMHSAPLVLAVDGGNSKTHLALARADGEVAALVQGPLSSPHLIGDDGCIEVLEALLADACRQAGLNGRGGPVAEVGHVLLAGADLPAEERRLQAAIGARGWAQRTSVANDTFAVLRAGTDDGWGVAITCGAGINCVGVAPDGRQARFPALGPITGDWGGGYDVGLAALSAAARSADGRGAATALESVVPAHFGLRTPGEVGEAVHERRIDGRRLIELAPLVLALATEDTVAGEIADRLAREVVALARVTVDRLDLAGAPVAVVLGGGLLRNGNGTLIAAIREGVAAVAPRAAVNVAADPPIVGAALLGLDDMGAQGAARSRLRRELRAAVDGASANGGPDG